MIEITEEVKQQLIATGWTEQEVNELIEDYPVVPDKELFHKVDAQGRVTGIFDLAIINYIMEIEDLFVLGEQLYIYQKGAYRKDVNGNIIKSKIQALLYDNFVSARNITRVYNLLIMQIALKKETWELNQHPDYWINFRNGMYDLKEGKLYPHSPRYYSINQIPHRYEAIVKDSEKYKNSEYFLQSALATPDIKTILQFMGLCMTINTSYQFFLMLLGEGGNGKSILISILECIVGMDNISNVPLCDLTRQFYPAQLLGKLVNACADVSKVAIGDDAMIKKITGGDRIPCEFKGKDSFFFTPYAKLFFSANRFPHVDDKSDGFKRRTRVINMNKKPEKPDITLKQKLIREIEYWVFLAVQAAREVFITGEIYESENSKALKEEIAKKSDSVHAFIADCMLFQEGHNVKRSETFEEYKQYCRYYDRIALGRSAFFKEMESKKMTAVKNHEGIYVYRHYVFNIWNEDDDGIFNKK